MTRDEIGDMIAALPQNLEPDDLIYRLVNWAVDKEREACAKVCEDMPTPKHPTTLAHIPTLETCAAAIRARGEK